MEYRPSPEETSYAILESLVYLADVARNAGLTDVLWKISTTIDFLKDQKVPYERSHPSDARPRFSAGL
jgi:hypothetical protein